jgi:hemoglobin
MGGSVTEAQLALLVDRFYASVRNDVVLGPVFNGAISDWPEHLERMVHFWSSVMLTSGRYKGNPMAAHVRHRDKVDPSMFGRWLQLWGETARDTLDEGGAAGVISKAERMAETLKLAMFFRLETRAA